MKTVAGVVVGRHGTATVVTMPAEAGWANFAELRDGLCRVLNEGGGPVVADFTGTALLDTSALVLLARTYVRGQLLGRPLRVVAPMAAVPLRHALEATGLAALLPPYPDLPSALTTRDRPRCAPAAEVCRMLDRIGTLRLTAGGTAVLGQGRGLSVEVREGPAEEATVVTAVGPLDGPGLDALAGALGGLVDGGVLHLAVALHTEPVPGFEPLPLLLGTRWRVAALGGCLALPVRPPRLEAVIEREGLRPAFTACPGCAGARPATATAPGALPPVHVGT